MNIKYAIQGDIGRESAQNILAVSRQLARSLEGQTTIKTIEIDSAKAIIKVNVDTAFIIIIVSDLTGVIFHPRSGSIEMLPYTEYISGPYGSMPVTKYLPGVAGGWRDGKTELTTEYIYPLVDEDNASFLVSKEDDEEELLGEFLGENGNYGNLYWWNGDEEEPVFLSWKGTPTRHFRLPSNIQIPGFSTFETSSPGIGEDTPIYTAFGTKLYQDGTVLAGAPRWNWPYNPSGVGNRCLILGSCQNKGTGKIYIVCQSDYHNAPENVFIFSDGTRLEGAESIKGSYLAEHPDVTLLFEKAIKKLGIYTVLFSNDGSVDGWNLVSEHNTGKIGLPFFSDTSGTFFVSSGGHILTIEGSFTFPMTQTGRWLETGTSGTVCKEGSFYSVYDGTAYFEPNTSCAVYGSFNATSSKNYPEDIYRTLNGSFPMYYDPNNNEEATQPLLISPATSDNAVVGTYFAYGASGGRKPYTWTFDGFIVNENNIVMSAPGCGMGSVTVTDNCGESKTKKIRLPTGTWYTESIVTYSGTWVGHIQYEDIQGEYRYREHIGSYCGGGPGCATALLWAYAFPGVCRQRSFTTRICKPTWCTETIKVTNGPSMPVCSDSQSSYTACSCYTCTDFHTGYYTQSFEPALCVSKREIARWVCP